MAKADKAWIPDPVQMSTTTIVGGVDVTPDVSVLCW
jgi:hypothetical protein